MMPSRKELEDALRAADQAGNTEDATRLANALANFKDTPNVDKLKAEFDALPWQSKIGQAADDVVRLGVDGLTLGFGDRMIGKLTGQDEVAKTEEARARAGSAAFGAELLGMLVPGFGASKAAGALTGLKGNRIVESAGREMIAGGAVGAGNALGHQDEDPGTQAAIGAAGGAIAGPLGVKIGDAIQAGSKRLGFKPGLMVDDVVEPKTADELRMATANAYDEVDKLGTRYDPSAFQIMTADMRRDLQAERINKVFHPKASKMASDIRHLTPQQITPRNLDDLRRVINRDVSGSGPENYMAGIMRDHIDDFIKKGQVVPPVNPGDTADAANAALAKARDSNRRLRTLEDIDAALYKGENAAGHRGDVAALRSMLNNPRKTRGMSEEEIAALEQVVRGSKIENFLNAMDGGMPITPLGLGIVVGSGSGNPLAGLAAGGGAMALQPLARAGARKYTDSSIQALKDAVAGGRRTPAAIRSGMPPLSQTFADFMIEEDRRKTRNKD